jgi:hypothetical protein
MLVLSSTAVAYWPAEEPTFHVPSTDATPARTVRCGDAGTGTVLGRIGVALPDGGWVAEAGRDEYGWVGIMLTGFGP